MRHVIHNRNKNTVKDVDSGVAATTAAATTTTIEVTPTAVIGVPTVRTATDRSKSISIYKHGRTVQAGRSKSWNGMLMQVLAAAAATV
jgi:hypothetical protein